MATTEKELGFTFAESTIVALEAYKVAVANGFEGTYEEWLKTLKGPQGDKPIKGVDYWTDEDKAAILADTTVAGKNLVELTKSANNAGEELGGTISTANEAKTALDKSTKSANSAKSALDKSVTTANTTKSDIDTANATAVKNIEDLAAVGTYTKPEIDSKVSSLSEEIGTLSQKTAADEEDIALINATQVNLLNHLGLEVTDEAIYIKEA